jgi:hypothetical protein
MSAEPVLSSCDSGLKESRGPNLPSYSDLAVRANALRLALDCRALACVDPLERARLRDLCQKVTQVHECLKPRRLGVR